MGAAGAPAPCSEKESHLSFPWLGAPRTLVLHAQTQVGGQGCGGLWSSELFSNNAFVQLGELLRGMKPWADFT